MIMSSFKCEAFGNSVTLGMGTYRPRNTSVIAHLGDAPGGFACVVIVLDVDHQALEQTGHLRRHLLRELLELTGLDERGDVVVGVKPLLLRLQAGANAMGDRL
jgi:hypothetical protein